MIHCPVTVRNDVTRKRQTSSEEHAGPVDGVEAEDVFADYVNICWPTVGATVRAGCRAVAVGPWESRDGEVVYESVDPHVDDLRRVAWDGDAPAKASGRPRDGEIAQAVLDFF